MRLIGSLLVWISLAVGAISAATAYMPATSLPDALFAEGTGADGATSYVELARGAGPLVEQDGDTVPQFAKGTELTPEVLGQMRAPQPDGKPLVQRVKLDAFSFERWTHRWWFLGAVGGLLVGGLGPRLLAPRAQAAGASAGGGQGSPEQRLAAITADVARLRADLVGLSSDRERNAAIVASLGELQQTDLPAFVDTREVVVGRIGLGGYASMMDHYASAERAINRAWSAAADGNLHEALESLELVEPSLSEAASRLGPARG